MRFFLVALLATVVSLGAQEAPPPAFGFLLQALSKSEDPALQINLLRGINKALEGRRGLAAPPEWTALAEKLASSPSAEVREQVQTLGAVFGSSAALEGMRKILANGEAENAAREKALESLLAAKDKEVLPILLKLIKEPGPLRRSALRGLASIDNPQIAEAILGVYGSLENLEKREAISTLLARAASAKALVAALDAQRLSSTDLSATEVRQLRSFKEPAIEDWLRRNPALMTTSPDKKAEIARYRALLTPEYLSSGDVHRGRAIFTQSCAVCHRLFDTGGDIGPELTGANRGDVDYLLQNVLDPNAMIGKDYQNTTVEAKDGQMLVGMVRGEDANTLTLKTLVGLSIVPRSDIKNVTVSEVSMMPEGLLAPLTPEQTRDLFAYLASPRQVAFLATQLNAGDFFNGTDLARWRHSGDEWTVPAGELIGRGNARQPAALVSEMVLGDYRLSAKMQLRGERVAVEVTLRGGLNPERFHGLSLSFGGEAKATILRYEKDAAAKELLVGPAVPNARWCDLEITAQASQVRVKIDGKLAFDCTAPGSELRTVPAIYVFGEGAELRLKDVKLEVPE